MGCAPRCVRRYRKSKRRVASEIFTQAIAIASGDIDELGHVNNVVYLRWAQDIATSHWRARAGDELIARYVWVVARHEIDYRAPLLLGDAIEARTWVAQAASGALWPRTVEIGKPGEKPAVSVVTQWCLLDAATRRVRRVPGELVSKFSD